MQKPFLALIIALISGLIIPGKFKMTLFSIFLILGLLLIIHLVFRSKRKLCLMLVFFLGLTLAIEQKKDMEIDGNQHLIEARIIEVERESENYSKYMVQAVEIDGKSSRKKLLVSYFGQGNLRKGDYIKLSGVFKEALSNTNPGAFNYKLYLKSKGVGSIVEVDQGKLQILHRKSLDYGPIHFENRLDKSLESLSERKKNLLKSLVLGKSDYIDKGDLENFRELGLAHILAVSGLHIGVIGAFVRSLVIALGMSINLGEFISIGILIYYGYLIGFPVSVIRAISMFTFKFIAVIREKYYDPINILLGIGFFMLILKPYLIYNLSFQLSFLACLSIFYIGSKLRRLYIRGDDYLSKALCLSLSVSIGLMPLQVYYFKNYNFLTIFANIIIVPIISFIIPLIFINFFIFNKFKNLSFGVLYLISKLLDLVFSLVGRLSLFDLFKLKTVLRGSYLSLYILFFLLVFKLVNLNKLSGPVNKSLVYFSIFTIFISGLTYNNNFISIDFIDVGQGDAILLRDNRSNNLIDTGGSYFRDVGKNDLGPYLDYRSVGRLDRIFISHFDYDHYGNLAYLLDNYEVGKIYINTLPEEEEIREVLLKAREKGVEIQMLKAGDIIKIARDKELKVLDRSRDYKDENNNSMVLKGEFYSKSILFTGDIEEEREKDLIGNISKVDFLKLAHHGSETSSSDDFINRLRPEFAIISLGRNNRFGHPSKEVIEKLENLGSEIYRTDQDGLINIYISNDFYSISRYLEEKVSLEDFLYSHLLEIGIYCLFLLASKFLIIIYVRSCNFGLQNTIE